MKKSVISCRKYMPANRLSREEYINAWGRCASEIKEKTVMDVDEDILTMAVEVSADALADVDKNRVGVLTIASSAFPYEEKLAAGTVAEALGIKRNILTAQHSGSSLAGMEAFISGMGFMDYVEEEYALVVISDAPQSNVSGELDHSLGAGACAFVIKKEKEGQGVYINNLYSTVKESLGVRYRPAGSEEIKDIGVRAYSSGEYNSLISESIIGLMKKENEVPESYREVILPQVNMRENNAIAKKLGFKDEQIKNSQIFKQTGDTGACASFLPFCRILENASEGEKIILCAYGTGAGACSASFYVNKKVDTGKSLQELLDKRQYINYVQYLKLKQVI